MFNRKSTNADITKHDWAQRDRAALLRSLHAGCAPFTPAEGSSRFGTNVVHNDPCSVLSGKGDLRTTWWNLYCAVYMATVSSATLEQAMYSFHRIHRRLTLSGLRFADSLAQAKADVQRKGICDAVRNSIVREIRR